MGLSWNHDHRYRAQRYCVTLKPDGFTRCGREATWYVDDVTVCSYHKGVAFRANPDYDAEKIREVIR